jgi:threonine dehydrogenase-like Zn-dependent dehydrogenase
VTPEETAGWSCHGPNLTAGDNARVVGLSDAVATGHIDLDLLVGARYALEQAEDALQANQVDDSLLKVVVRP